MTNFSLFCDSQHFSHCDKYLRYTILKGKFLILAYCFEVQSRVD